MESDLKKYQDIYEEYQRWLRSGPTEANRIFPADGVKVEGFSAADIKKIQPALSGEGVYRFLVDLRDSPEEMKSYLAEGLPIL